MNRAVCFCISFSSSRLSNIDHPLTLAIPSIKTRAVIISQLRAFVVPPDGYGHGEKIHQVRSINRIVIPQVVENASRGLRAPPRHHRTPIDYFRILPLDILSIFYYSATRLSVYKRQCLRASSRHLRLKVTVCKARESNIVRI
jgi:hypothetical protein